MKCYKCGKEAPLKNGLCNECYRNIIQNKYRKRKERPKDNFILNNIEKNEKIIEKIETGKIANTFLLLIFATSVILFPRTIVEFFIHRKNAYFLLLLFNIILFFIGIYFVIYLESRDILLTNKRIIGKWGLFKIKKINIPLNKIQFIDTSSFDGLELDTDNKNYFFDFVGNGKSFKISTIEQIKKLIDSTDNEIDLNAFSHSIQQTLKDYQKEKKFSTLIVCDCCKKSISKDSAFCVHCGHPILENERSADLFITVLCFCLPPIGLILFLLNIGPFPKFAKQCLLSSVLSVSLLIITILSLISVL